MTDQSSEDPTQTGEFGPMPTPKVEPGETAPGGPDAVPDPDEVIAADLDPDKNPATDDSPDEVKESLKEGEDTETQATMSAGPDDDDTGAAPDDSAESPA